MLNFAGEVTDVFVLERKSQFVVSLHSISSAVIISSLLKDSCD